MTRSKGRYFALASVTIAGSTLITLLALLGADLYLHAKYRDAAYNVWGYRGPVVAAKEPGEHRIVMLGGSTTLGYGVGVDETIPYYLERELQQRVPGTPVRVVNLGWNSEGAYSYQFTLEDYAYLDYDTVVLYSGYNDFAPNL